MGLGDLLVGLAAGVIIVFILIYGSVESNYNARVSICTNGFTLHYVDSANFGEIHNVNEATLYNMAHSLNFTEIYSTKNVGYYVFNGTEAWSWVP